MSFFSTLRRSISPLTQHFPIQRFQIPHSSCRSSPSILNYRKGFFAAIVAGTSLGFLLYTDFDSNLFQSSISSFVDLSTPNSSDNQKRRRFSPSSFFTKFSLPETSGTFSFRGKFLSRNFIYFKFKKVDSIGVLQIRTGERFSSIMRSAYGCEVLPKRCLSKSISSSPSCCTCMTRF